MSKIRTDEEQVIYDECFCELVNAVNKCAIVSGSFGLAMNAIIDSVGVLIATNSDSKEDASYKVDLASQVLETFVENRECILRETEKRGILEKFQGSARVASERMGSKLFCGDVNDLQEWLEQNGVELN